MRECRRSTCTYNHHVISKGLIPYHGVRSTLYTLYFVPIGRTCKFPSDLDIRYSIHIQKEIFYVLYHFPVHGNNRQPGNVGTGLQRFCFGRWLALFTKSLLLSKPPPWYSGRMNFFLWSTEYSGTVRSALYNRGFHSSHYFNYSIRNYG